MNRDLRFAPTFVLPPDWFIVPAPMLRGIIPKSLVDVKHIFSGFFG